MSSPVFLADDLAPDRVDLTGPEGRHAATVRRLRVGEAVDLVDGQGTRATCVVCAVGKDRITCDVLARTTEPLPALRVVLVQALAKGDRGELAVELATEVGVDVVVPWSASRSVVRWEGERGEKALARWRSTAREAGKQSRRARHPEVTAVATTAEVTALLRAAALGLVLHESAETSLAGIDLPADGDVVVVVGPEGGFSDLELGVFEPATVVRLGPSVLRTSTAGAVATAVVSARSGRWD